MRATLGPQMRIPDLDRKGGWMPPTLIEVWSVICKKCMHYKPFNGCSSRGQNPPESPLPFAIIHRRVKCKLMTEDVTILFYEIPACHN